MTKIIQSRNKREGWYFGLDWETEGKFLENNHLVYFRTTSSRNKRTHVRYDSLKEFSRRNKHCKR